MVKVILSLLMMASVSSFANDNTNTTNFGPEFATCREGATSTGWVRSNCDSKHAGEDTPVLLICRGGDWVYDSSLNGGYIPPNCN